MKINAKLILCLQNVCILLQLMEYIKRSASIGEMGETGKVGGLLNRVTSLFTTQQKEVLALDSFACADVLPLWSCRVNPIINTMKKYRETVTHEFLGAYP